MNKKSFVMYTDWHHLVKALSDEQAGNLIKSIFDYQIGNITPPAEQMTSAIYDMMCERFIVDDEKYEAICERNRKNGAKGGRPKQDEEKPTGFSGLSKKTQKNPKNPEIGRAHV